mmetsp:Transcript_3034/g.12261  ORF Transcript_3034/g.12261 Transcript_3034/m.12261 type:complete len:302 (-) Transcript_3034:1136-2041(-)
MLSGAFPLAQELELELEEPLGTPCERLVKQRLDVDEGRQEVAHHCVTDPKRHVRLHKLQHRVCVLVPPSQRHAAHRIAGEGPRGDARPVRAFEVPGEAPEQFCRLRDVPVRHEKVGSFTFHDRGRILPTCGGVVLVRHVQDVRVEGPVSLHVMRQVDHFPDVADFIKPVSRRLLQAEALANGRVEPKLVGNDRLLQAHARRQILHEDVLRVLTVCRGQSCVRQGLPVLQLRYDFLAEGEAAILDGSPWAQVLHQQRLAVLVQGAEVPVALQIVLGNVMINPPRGGAFRCRGKAHGAQGARP